MSKYTETNLPDIKAGLNAPRYRALASVPGLALPTDIAAELVELAGNVQHVRDASIPTKTPNTIADTLAGGGKVTASDVTQAAIAATWAQVKDRAYKTAVSHLEAVATEAGPHAVEALQVQVVDPAVETLTAAIPLAGETPGSLFDQSRDDDAALLREAQAAHGQIVRAVELAVKLGATEWRTSQVRSLDAVLGYVDEHGTVDLLGVAPEVEPTPAQMPQNFKVNGVTPYTSNESSN